MKPIKTCPKCKGYGVESVEFNTEEETWTEMLECSECLGAGVLEEEIHKFREGK